MFKYIMKRLGLSVLILLGVSLIIYTLVRCMPVQFVQNKVDALRGTGAEIDEATVQKMYEMYGLSDSSFAGILHGYFSWLKALCRFDLGNCFTNNRPVAEVIREKMGVSFAVAFISIIFEYMIAIPLGVTAATHQYSMRDYLATVFVMIGISMPSFFFGQILKDVFAMKLDLFPAAGLIDASVDLSFGAMIFDYLRHLFLPLLTLTILSIGGLMRYTRTNMLEVLSADYIRTARAKGLSEGKVIYKHAFRNTMIPIVTMLAGVLPSLFSGSMITEQVFSLPGIGLFAYKALTTGDIPFIMGYNMFLAVLSVIGILLSDLMYAVVDPRVKLTA